MVLPSISASEVVRFPEHSKRETCRVCGERDLHLILALGPMPLANSFLSSPTQFSTEGLYPLDAYFCQACSLVQLADVVSPEILFRNYVYVTGTSQTIAAHNSKYAKEVVGYLNLIPADLIVEIASNDGSLLRCFQKLGLRTVGVEPATNIAEQARLDGINTVNDFFDLRLAQELRRTHGPVKAVIANNVLAHVDQTPNFLRGCRHLLADEGQVIIEVPYLRDLVEQLEFDTIYHEHLSYFSVTSLLKLFDLADLSITRIDRVPVHGGSLRVYAGIRNNFASHAEYVLDMAAEERRAGLTNLQRLERFANDIELVRSNLVTLLGQLRAEGKVVAAYGAPAKGNTLLNYCGIDTHLISFTVDKNPLKVGLFTPGSHIPVLPVTAVLERQPDYLLILAWNFAEEIMEQQYEYRDRGGKFIIPIPKPEVV